MRLSPKGPAHGHTRGETRGPGDLLLLRGTLGCGRPAGKENARSPVDPVAWDASPAPPAACLSLRGEHWPRNAAHGGRQGLRARRMGPGDTPQPPSPARPGRPFRWESLNSTLCEAIPVGFSVPETQRTPGKSG